MMPTPSCFDTPKKFSTGRDSGHHTYLGDLIAIVARKSHLNHQISLKLSDAHDELDQKSQAIAIPPGLH